MFKKSRVEVLVDLELPRELVPEEHSMRDALHGQGEGRAYVSSLPVSSHCRLTCRLSAPHKELVAKEG